MKIYLYDVESIKYTARDNKVTITHKSGQKRRYFNYQQIQIRHSTLYLSVFQQENLDIEIELNENAKIFVGEYILAIERIGIEQEVPKKEVAVNG